MHLLVQGLDEVNRNSVELANAPSFMKYNDRCEYQKELLSLNDLKKS